MTSWTLADVTASARAHPTTFFIPPEAERRSLRPGQLVQLHSALTAPGPDEPTAERMWVEVSRREAAADDVRYEGQLTNQPRYIKDLAPGATIHFAAEHVARVLVAADHPDFLEIGEQKALVSARVLEAGNGVRWCYREPPEQEEDSGWRLFAGNESDDWVNDPANIRRCSVYWMIDRDPSLRDVLKAEIGAAFERGSLDTPWHRARGWSGPEE